MTEVKKGGKDLEDRKRRRLKERRDAYRLVFGEDDPMRAKAVRIVLEDLGFYAYLHQAVPIAKTERGLDRVEGRREAVHRINEFRTMDLDTLYAVYEQGHSREAAWLMKQERERREQ